MYTVQITNISTGVVVIQDPYPSEGRLTIPLDPGEVETRELIDSQYDRVKAQLDWHAGDGRITYTAYNGPASKIMNDSGVPGLTVKEALDNLAGGITGTSDMFLSGGREGAAISNVYLRGPGGTPTNQSGFVIPYDATIVALSLATTGAHTWTLEVRKNNNPAVIASLTVAALERTYDSTINVDIDAGDELQLYCNGTNINAPSGSLVLRRR
ncbi:MAG: hypothetical protein DRP01_00100 [Archaeoglobales archaeon]|nr:MAG: hypothetical protein DRP01_00100 [Archaeoglobales archaeon]